MLRSITLSCVLLGSAAHGQDFTARTPLRVAQVRAADLPEVPGGAMGPAPATPRVAEHRLIVKFQDALLARADSQGRLRSLAGASILDVQALGAELGFPLRFRPLLSTDPATLAELETRAAARSGRAQPDLAGMLIVELERTSAPELERIGQALNDLAAVEWAWIELLNPSPPGDIAPPTPDLSGFQGYRDPNPGLDVTYAWSVGARGQGVRVSDCEYGWDPAHEDLHHTDLNLEPGQTISAFVFANGWDDHGTAALGEVAAEVNGFGCDGMAPDAEFYTWPEYTDQEGPRRVTAITNAIAASSFGDVVMLEMQTALIGSNYGPAELNPAVWTVCQTGSDAGVIVVGAAGNGNQNLDSSFYATYQSWGDSGAILVGAGTDDANHSKLSFSTYGSRINLQGWGTGVFTLGYGYFNNYGGDPQQSYTASFSGTSSATPFVASACAALQSYLVAQGNPRLDGTAMRNLLVSTGLAQGSGGNIGPFPDLRAAIDSLSNCQPPQNYCGTSPNSAGPGALIAWGGSTSLSANDGQILVSGAPPSVFGLFFFGSAETSTPLGDGQLCVAGGGQGLIRMPAQQTSVVGDVQRALDYTQFPLNSGPGQVSVGQMARWQFWYRDLAAGATGFNLSDALRVLYCP